MLLDCHSACSAVAFDYREKGLDPGLAADELPSGWTRAMNIEFLRPTPTDTELTLKARVIKRGRKSRTVACSIYANGEECARAEVIVVMAEN
jgi:acyl-CoA thioesterase FadM